MKSIFLCMAMVFTVVTFSQKQEVHLGNLKVNHHVKDTLEVRKFYKDVLGMKLITPKSPVPRDYVEFSNGFRINIIYLKENVPSIADFHEGLWIRIHTADFKNVAERVRQSGVKIIRDKVEKNEIYFQAPGGQIFRMGEILYK
ncbi:VOC family protein [uncultured Allomuricauda sp.]|uniref:VOC family protein n=1 Tax=Flagellimonas sp. W118 TaxID=3410791 RepID=UPI0026312062|nr:VOC family protein [uncultured Allomuricauda sp.]